VISLPKPIGVCLLTMAFLGAFAGSTSFLVTRSAEETAGSQPYCIQIADGTSDYRPARSWLELSAFAMRATRDGPLYMQHHAILVVGSRADPMLYHWTYRHGGFVPGVLNGKVEGRGPAVTCIPVRSFVATLAIVFATSPDESYVKYSGREAYRIPNVWQPKWNGGMRPTLQLGTTAPDFRPLRKRWDGLLLGERDDNWLFIEWNPEWLLSVMSDSSNENIVERGMEYGLSKQKSITRSSKDGRDLTGYGYLTYGDGHDINVTMIGCGMPSDAVPKSCQHRFINKGRHFYFRHRLEDVPDWRGMQQRIVALMDAFEVHDMR